MYVAQRADKERESVIRQLSAPVDAVKDKLAEMEETLAGFQRTMHLVLSEVDADRERSAAIAVRNLLLVDASPLVCGPLRYFGSRRGRRNARAPTRYLSTVDYMQ